LNDQRGRGFRSEAVHGLQLHHPVTSVRMMRQPPAAVPTAIAQRETDHPRRQDECWRFQKIKPTRQVIEAACLCAGKKRERDNTHRFLGVICAVACAIQAALKICSLQKATAQSAA